MAKQRDSFRLGLTVLVTLALFVAVILFIGSGFEHEKRVPFVVRFPHTLNLPLLEDGADVVGFGRVVGKITKLREVEAPDPQRPSAGPMLYLEVEAKINESVNLRQDCRIVAEGPPLGGRGFLRVADRGSTADKVDPAKPVYGAASGFAAALDLISAELDEKNPEGMLYTLKHQLDPDVASSLISKVHRSMDDMNALTKAIVMQADSNQRGALITKLSLVLDNLNLTTGYLRDQVTPDREGVILAQVQTALDSLNEGLVEAAGLLKDNRPHISSTIQSVERTAATLDTGVATPIARELDKTNPEGVMGMLHVAFGNVMRSLGDLNVVTDQTKRVVVLNADRLGGLIENVKETSDHLKATSKDLRRNPWRLLYRPSLEETKELNIFDAAREFSEASARLDDSASQLRSLVEARGGSVPTDDPDLARIRAHLLETFEKFQAAEKSLWEQLGTK